MELRICHLYPDVLNLYGDRGNVICMEKRLLWRGIGCTVTRVGIGESADFSEFDLFFIGGGQDFEQEVLLSDLHGGKDRQLIDAIEDGKTILAICGGYQMLGNYYETHEGVKCYFLGAVDFYTKGRDMRMIGDYTFSLNDSLGGAQVVGFENHSGQTFLGEGINPLGRVIKGYGNNGEDGSEGVHYKNVFGTYSHGPVLPKNPEFTDVILKSALERKYGKVDLAPLKDEIENMAKKRAIKDIMG